MSQTTNQVPRAIGVRQENKGKPCCYFLYFMFQEYLPKAFQVHLLTATSHNEKALTSWWGFGRLCEKLVLFHVVVGSCQATARAVKRLCQGAERTSCFLRHREPGTRSDNPAWWDLTGETVSQNEADPEKAITISFGSTTFLLWHQATAKQYKASFQGLYRGLYCSIHLLVNQPSTQN